MILKALKRIFRPSIEVEEARSASEGELLVWMARNQQRKMAIPRKRPILRTRNSTLL